MKKIVNVYPRGPITTLNPPIRTRVMGIKLKTEDIRKCIIENATVEEVLSDKRLVKLTFENYDKDNEIKQITEEPKAEATPVDPVVEETKVEETVDEVAEEPKVEETVDEVAEDAVVEEEPIEDKEKTVTTKNNKKSRKH